MHTDESKPGSPEKRVGMNTAISSKHMHNPVGLILKGYAAIFFGESVLAGLLVMLASFWNPEVGLAGLAMATLAALLPRWMDLPWPDSPVHVCNAALVGLFLAVLRTQGLGLLPWLVLAAGLVVTSRIILGDLLWRWNHLPLLIDAANTAGDVERAIHSTRVDHPD